MSNTKMTYGKAVDYVLKNCDLPEDVREKMGDLAVSLAKKNGSERKPTATQVANEGYKAAILEYLTDVAEGKTVSDILKEVPAVAGFSNQKVSALMTQLVDEGNGPVEKYSDKRRTYFRVKQA